LTNGSELCQQSDIACRTAGLVSHREKGTEPMGKKAGTKSTGPKKASRSTGPDVTGRPSDAPQGDAAAATPKMKTKEYEKQMRLLHAELVAMQEWVKATGAKVCIVFEGRDTAGKGGTIKRITERVSPRVFRVVALSAPTDREKSQMYVQRYVPHFPAAGEVIIFDRSWYNRAGDPRKIWKLSDMDLKSYSRWYDYSRARDDMFRATDTSWAPWFVAHTDDKKRGRLNIISHLLGQVPYEPLPKRDVKLPKRKDDPDYVDPELPLRHIPEKF